MELNVSHKGEHHKSQKSVVCKIILEPYMLQTSNKKGNLNSKWTFR